MSGRRPATSVWVSAPLFPWSPHAHIHCKSDAVCSWKPLRLNHRLSSQANSVAKDERSGDVRDGHTTAAGAGPSCKFAAHQPTQWWDDCVQISAAIVSSAHGSRDRRHVRCPVRQRTGRLRLELRDLDGTRLAHTRHASTGSCANRCARYE
jgi:hypothetical protein